MEPYRIGSIMRADAPTLSATTPIRRAVAALVEAGSGAAAVLGDDGRLVGILTQKDCFRPVLHASYHHEWSGRVGDFMSGSVVTADIDDEVVHAAAMFLEHPHRTFPVLDGDRVAGMLDRADVLAFLTLVPDSPRG